MCLCLHLCQCVSVSVPVCLSVHRYKCSSLSACMYVCVFMCLCLHLCQCVSVSVLCLCVCQFIDINAALFLHVCAAVSSGVSMSVSVCIFIFVVSVHLSVLTIAATSGTTNCGKCMYLCLFSQGTAIFDFSDTGYEVHGNCNAPRAVTLSGLIYCLRSMVGHDIPLNQVTVHPDRLTIHYTTAISNSNNMLYSSQWEIKADCTTKNISQ